MGNRKYNKPKIITLAQQATMIDLLYIDFKCKISSYGKLVIVGKIQPTPLSRNYTVRITYTIGDSPLIEVINPKFEEIEEKLPHVYKKNTLCLFYPKNKEWTKHDYIAEKIIPWISLWLYYYEIWSITGKWEGGGKHPSCEGKRKNRK